MTLVEAMKEGGGGETRRGEARRGKAAITRRRTGRKRWKKRWRGMRKTWRERKREGGWEGGCWGLVWKISTSYKSGVVGMKLEGKVVTRWGLVVEVAT